MAEQTIDLEHALSIHCYNGEPKSPISEDDEQAVLEAAETSALVRSLYTTGVPLYSKENLREILTQLKSDSDQVSVRAIDGQLVSFRRQTGEIYKWDSGPGYDCLIGPPFIELLSIQEILENVREYKPPLSLCSLCIYHYILRRSLLSGKILHPTPDQTKDNVIQYFESHMKAWEASEDCKQLRVALSNIVKPRVTKVIAFACGGMAFSNHTTWTTNSAYQHALILTIKDIISNDRNQPDTIELYAQDPIYCDLDRDVLTTYGINALNCPEGFLEVDSSSAVLSFGPNIAVRQIVADIALPAVMIWDKGQSMPTEIEEYAVTDPDSPRLTTMLNSYAEIPFAKNVSAFDGTAIYVRKDGYLVEGT